MSGDPAFPGDEPAVEDLGMAPALCARRLYQIGAALVAAHTLQARLSPVQFAARQAVQRQFMRLLVTLLEAHENTPPAAGPGG